MSEKRKIKTKQGSGLLKIITGVGVGLLVFLFLLSVSAVVFSKSNLDFENLKYFIFVALPLGACIGAFYNGFHCKEIKGMISGVLTSFLIAIVAACLLLIANAGMLTGAAIVLLLLTAAVGCPAGIVGANLR